MSRRARRPPRGRPMSTGCQRRACPSEETPMKASLMTRLALLEAAGPEQSWQHTQGLSELLAYHKAYPGPPLDRAAVTARAEAGDGMARLLVEAWQWGER